MIPEADNSFHFHYALLWGLIGFVAIGLVFYLSLVSDPPEILGFSFADKLQHMLAYCVLMGWFCQLYNLRNQQVFLAIAFCLMGGSLEFVQDWGGHRFFEVADMLANTIGVLLGWWLSRGWCSGWLYRVDQVLFHR